MGSQGVLFPPLPSVELVEATAEAARERAQAAFRELEELEARAAALKATIKAGEERMREIVSSHERAREDLRAEVRRGLDKGARCPVCDQMARRYRRKLNAGMAAFLIRLAGATSSKRPWVHHSSLFYSGRDYSYLTHWGLAETRTEVDPDSGARRSGYWRPTRRGLEWIAGAIRVPRYLRIYNGEPEGLEGEPISAREAIGDAFDWEELWAAGPQACGRPVPRLGPDGEEVEGGHEAEACGLGFPCPYHDAAERRPGHGAP